MKQNLIDRIREYLGNGGLFNPELMDHDKVRDLLVDVKSFLEKSFSLEEATELLSQQLHDQFPAHFSVGSDKINTIYVYELKKGHAKDRLKEFQGYKVVSKYIGTISAKPAR